ncbi:hypothetical protein RUM43_006149 [Polyplax serrata]|uniref:Uncharacterized protein n=1 Tax=Polyplax serrata TaxID=468196 RepID=A0AAN8PC73_POLSC
MNSHCQKGQGLSAQLTFAVIDETFQNFNISGIGELPGNLTSKLPSETDIEEALTKKCQKLEGPEAGMRVTVIIIFGFACAEIKT